MKIFDRLLEYFVYLKDKFGVQNVPIKIERFDIDKDGIVVLYRMGRQKLLQRDNLNSFQDQFFERISYFDQHRLTKFSTMQNVLVFFAEKEEIVTEIKKFIRESIKNEQLF